MIDYWGKKLFQGINLSHSKLSKCEFLIITSSKDVEINLLPKVMLLMDLINIEQYPETKILTPTGFHPNLLNRYENWVANGG